jgi:hypothetical protein
MLKRLFAICVLACALSSLAHAGDIETPLVTSPPPSPAASAPTQPDDFSSDEPTVGELTIETLNWLLGLLL